MVSISVMLEHLPDPMKGLQEMIRVLRPGAPLVLVVTWEQSFASPHHRSGTKRRPAFCGHWQAPFRSLSLIGFLRIEPMNVVIEQANSGKCHLIGNSYGTSGNTATSLFCSLLSHITTFLS